MPGFRPDTELIQELPAVQVSQVPDYPWRIRRLEPGDRPALVLMYTHFQPKRAAQGLPPEDPRRLDAWLDDVLARGLHVIAEAPGMGIIGHVMLMPRDEGSVELANFVDRAWRDRGLGTELNHRAIELAREHGWARIWLCVDASNRAAIRSYHKSGFRAVPGATWTPEIEMFIDLDSRVRDLGPAAITHG